MFNSQVLVRIFLPSTLPLLSPQKYRDRFPFWIWRYKTIASRIHNGNGKKKHFHYWENEHKSSQKLTQILKSTYSWYKLNVRCGSACVGMETSKKAYILLFSSYYFGFFRIPIRDLAYLRFSLSKTCDREINKSQGQKNLGGELLKDTPISCLRPLLTSRELCLADDSALQLSRQYPSDMGKNIIRIAKQL